MTHLLDVNALLALALRDHHDHQAITIWLHARPSATLATCAITEIGFVRVAVQAGYLPDVATAVEALTRAKSGPFATRFRLLPDDLGATQLPRFVKRPAHVTDGHLLALAHRHGAQLSTFDRGIPGADLIPSIE